MHFIIILNHLNIYNIYSIYILYIQIYTQSFKYTNFINHSLLMIVSVIIDIYY